MTRSHVRRRRKERGAIIFFVLLSMSLIAFMIHRVTTQTSTYSHLTLAYRNGFMVQDSLRERVTPPSSPERGCQEQVISVEVDSRTLAVCSTGTPKFNTSPPTGIPSGRIDYNRIFTNPERCPGARKETGNKSFDTPRAAMDCLLSATLDHSGILLDNIEAQDLLLTSSDGTQTLTIATPGFVTVSGTLTTMNSLLILAGGEISIGSIASHGNVSVRVTILSAHGSILVEKTSGDVSLLIVGRKLLSAPPTPFLSPFPLPPFRASPSIAGIIPSFRG